jgi:hypothetical protein
MTNEVSNKVDAPTPVKPSNALGSYSEAIRSNASVTGNLNSQFKYNQTDNGPYDEMSKGASVNRYLEKVAMSLIRAGAAFDKASPIAKVGLGLSTASLGISAANYHNTHRSVKAQEDKVNLERRSLTALNNINKTLTSVQLQKSAQSLINNIAFGKKSLSALNKGNKTLSTAQLHPSPVANKISGKI